MYINLEEFSRMGFEVKQVGSEISIRGNAELPEEMCRIMNEELGLADRDYDDILSLIHQLQIFALLRQMNGHRNR